MNGSAEIILTGDGSNTLFSPQFNEIYHSRHGAIAESKHVFIENGLAQFSHEPIHVFEVGFGTGLNALLAWDFAESNKKCITYFGVELFPVQISIALQLNYANTFNDQIITKDIFHQLHQSSWNKAFPIGDYFLFQKQHVNVLDLEMTSNRFDVIFFDAFAPAAQHELWQLNLFEKMFDALNCNGILVTYCSKGSVRRTMQAAGFVVEKLPGPPGKREMLRARKPS